MITINREALKTLSNLNIDTQAFYQKAAATFSYTGQVTPEYTAICIELKEVFNDIENAIKTLKPFVDNLTSGN